MEWTSFSSRGSSRGISVNDLQFYSNKMFDEEKLAALNEALAKLN